MRATLWTCVALILLLAGGAVYLGFKGDDLGGLLSKFKSANRGTEISVRGQSSPAEIVKKFRWKNSAGGWQLSDVAPAGESSVVYINKRDGKTSFAKGEKVSVDQQQSVDLNPVRAISRLPELLVQAGGINQQLTDRRALEEQARTLSR